MSLNSNTESMEELLAKANAMPTADAVYAAGRADAIETLKNSPIILIRGIHYGTEAEKEELRAQMPDGELPDGMFWGKVVE